MSSVDVNSENLASPGPLGVLVWRVLERTQALVKLEPSASFISRLCVLGPLLQPLWSSPFSVIGSLLSRGLLRGLHLFKELKGPAVKYRARVNFFAPEAGNGVRR